MVVVLIIIGISLVLLNIKAIKKEDNSFSSILNREQDITNRDYDVEIISIRKDLAESIFDIQKEMEEIKENIKNISENNNVKINYLENIEENLEEDDNIIIDTKSKDEGVISQINFNNKTEKLSKVDEVKILVKNGLTDEEICEKMSIGKGEVLLIKGLFKN